MTKMYWDKRYADEGNGAADLGAVWVLLETTKHEFPYSYGYVTYSVLRKPKPWFAKEWSSLQTEYFSTIEDAQAWLVAMAALEGQR
jgi:hypothetical protein